MSRAQKSKLGCLLQIVAFVVIGYYGLDWGMVYYRFWTLEQEMHSQADMAAGIDDATIQRRIHLKISKLNLPDEARTNLSIRRSRRPREIVISTSYVAQLKLPFRAPIERTLNPTARQALGSF